MPRLPQEQDQQAESEGLDVSRNPNMTIITPQRLERAADIVEERWMQHAYGRVGEHRCALGALAEACCVSATDRIQYNPRGRAAVCAAFGHPDPTGWLMKPTVSAFNDKPGRRASTVARRLRKAAAILRGDK